MIIAVNHLALAAEDHETVAAAYATLFGRPAEKFVSATGAELFRFQLSNIAFEIVAAASGESSGLRSIGFEASDIGATTHKLGRRGLASTAIVEETWTEVAGAKRIARRSASLTGPATHGVGLTIVETATDESARTTTSDPALVTGLDHVVVRSPNPERAIALYAGRLGLDFALDRSNPDWGSRLLFFRCAGVTVEIGHSLAKGVSDAADSLWGLAWRVGDATETQRRLQRAGLNTSEATKGRRPGSQVLTVRSGTGNVPTIMLSAAARDIAA